ncbi:MAG TPA: ABC transporter ATP-binding protein [Sedimentibacter sp.]|nr:ABC transporter ATP-binding protein [Sedimentibacter sp.]HNZ82368.1 ABC transporter ATP-binding protein [Sedimentibacter sp.]HOH69113.1 ABC transporter ATP-binding protein [Sedimentibacter sp.]
MYSGRMSGGRNYGMASDEEIKNRPKVTKELIFRIFSYLKPYRIWLFFCIITIVLISVLNVMPAVLTGRIIDEGFIGGDFSLLVMLIAASLGVMIASNLLSLFENYLNVRISQSITKDMKNNLYAHLQQMAHRFFTVNKQGDIITRMTSDVNGVQSVISTTLTSTVSDVAVLVTSMAAMFQKNLILSLVGILILPLFVIPTKAVGKKRWELAQKTQMKYDDSNQLLNETLSVSGQQLVKLFTNEEEEYKKYSEINEDIMKLRIRENMAGRWFRMAISTFTNMGPMLIYLVGGVLILKYNTQGLTVGDITVMVTLLTRMYRPVSSLLGVQVEFYRALILFERIFEYLDMPIEIKSKADAVIPSRIAGDLEFKNVNFHYSKDKEILKDVSFRVPAKSMTAVVGPSGSGKTTVTNLLLRLYDVVDGKITIDGIDIRDLDLKFLRETIGMVTQDAYLFNGTIRENLKYARKNATDDELIAACKEANIYDFISSLTDGFDTIVGNRGIKLSGGEKQRISIARVILKNPGIIVFDEATSSLDSISENLIQEAIEPLLKDRTSMVIAHRLSTIMAADQILVVDKGQIVEQGVHEELLKNGGVYKKLYETQFKHLINNIKGIPEAV